MLRIVRMLRVLGCAVLMMLAAGAQTPRPVDGTPLLRAKLALEMAHARVLENRFDAAGAALRDASKALADYENLSPGPHAETSAFIRTEMNTYAKNIAHEHGDALVRIELWQEPVDHWYEAIIKP